MLQQRFRAFLGIQPRPSMLQEHIVSAIGSFVGIFLVTLVSYSVVHSSDAPFVVASMGAGAVLVFTVPHGPLSQPWPLFGGNIISAFVGVTCYRIFPNLFIAAGCAVGLVIAVMHLWGCQYPPWGLQRINRRCWRSKYPRTWLCICSCSGCSQCRHYFFSSVGRQ
jgi:CBS-domain-containing membrane protein